MVKTKTLDPDSVDLIIIQGSMTPPEILLTPEDYLQKRQEEGYLDLGFHYLIKRDGYASVGVPLDKAGTHTPRYADRSIGVLMVGGRDSEGKDICNYTLDQFITLNGVIESIIERYPNARPKGLRDLYRGFNPGFDVEELLKEQL